LAVAASGEIDYKSNISNNSMQKNKSKMIIVVAAMVVVVMLLLLVIMCYSLHRQVEEQQEEPLPPGRHQWQRQELAGPLPPYAQKFYIVYLYFYIIFL
jgi:flagellar biosynthesis/type III secretory pathway M-ring protein FliF/YscJ